MIPSGRQVELVHGRQRATVVEVGATLRTYRVGDEDILDGFGVHEMSSAGRGQALIPWPNRLAGGSYEVDGATYQLPLTEPEAGNAIHGLVRFANWTLQEQTTSHAALTYRLHPQPGYPFLVDLRLDYRLDEAGLSVELTAANRGDGPCPFGAGAHPYLRIGNGGVDRLVLQAPGATCYRADPHGIPTARLPTEGTPFDLRQPTVIGDRRLDTAFTDAGGDPIVVELAEPGDGRRIRLWMDSAYRYYMVFTGDTLAPPALRRGVAVEPMTCAPNAFRTGDGLWMLDPGEERHARWGLTPIGY